MHYSPFYFSWLIFISGIIGNFNLLNNLSFFVLKFPFALKLVTWGFYLLMFLFLVYEGTINKVL